MSIFFVVLFSIIYAGDSSLPSKTTLESSRDKRDILWMEDDYYADDSSRAEGPKYSWFCSTCRMGLEVYQNGSFDACDIEAKWNNEAYPFGNCTSQQACEIFSKTDPDEQYIDAWWKEDSLKKYTFLLSPTPDGLPHGFNILFHRACCKTFGICDLKLGKSGKQLCEIYFNYSGALSEVGHRTCCGMGGLFCDDPVPEPPEDFVQSCKNEGGCTDDGGLRCCMASNVTCTIPECEIDICLVGVNGCLPLMEFGKCCEFYNKCDGKVCEMYPGYNSFSSS